MPCACKKPVENYPENADWGPLIWTLFHGLAELSGKQAVSLLQNDEIRLWITLLKGTTQMIPCDSCREHYASWILKNPVDILITLPYDQVHEWIRQWVFTLHNDVNNRLSKPIFPYVQLAKYTGVNITLMWRKLEPIMKLAIQLNGISLLPWKKWLATIRSLQGIYGV